MNLHSLLLVLAAMPLAACAQTAVAPQAPQAPQTSQPPRSELTAPLLYQFLLGEIAGQRGDPLLASEAYTDLAAKLRDPRVAKRATEIAMHARQKEQALHNARLWVELEPEGARARQTLITLMANAGLLAETKPHLEAWIRQGKPDEAFMQLHALLARHKDKAALAQLAGDLALAYPGLAEARYAAAQFALQAGQSHAALAGLNEALRIRPGWDAAALLKAQALHQKEGQPSALAYLEGYLKEQPKARDVRLAYAKQLARAGKVAEARREFELLAQESPQSPGAHYALGLVALQGNDLDTAHDSLTRAHELGHPDTAAIRLYLGQIEEARKRPELALEWYRGVDRGPGYLEARLRAANLLGKLGRLDEARKWIEATQTRNDGERIQLIQAEVMLLRDAKQLDAAKDALTRALEKMPAAYDLLYDRAMLSEKQGRLDLMEKDLLEIIRIKPDYAHAYNALGYTLADRTQRVQEAVKHLETALKLAPDDPFILDSMGWALYKARRLDEALGFLRRAHAAKPDPEIAAHLGEALWAKGERDEAQRIWRGSLQAHPDNEVLRETVSRLTR